MFRRSRQKMLFRRECSLGEPLSQDPFHPREVNVRSDEGGVAMKQLLSSCAKFAFRVANMNNDRPKRMPRGLLAGKRYIVNPCAQPGIYLCLYEYELQEHFYRLLKTGMRTFDIGSAMGFHAVGINNLTLSDVVCVEPNSAARVRLRENLAANGLSFPVVDAFIGAKTGPSTTTIDKLSEDYFAPDFLKIDIEGGEYNALQGAEHVLARHKPAMIIETHSVELETNCADFLRKAGYRICIVKQRRFMREGRSVAHNQWIVAQP